MATSQGRNHFYKRTPALINIDFTQTPTHQFGMTANHLIIVNDSRQNNLIFSFDGVDIDGEVFPKDKSLTLNWKLASRIWIKTSSATPDTPIRVWAWIE